MKIASIIAVIELWVSSYALSKHLYPESLFLFGVFLMLTMAICTQKIVQKGE